MTNIVDTLQNIEWELYNLHRSYFAGKHNKARDRRIRDLLKQRTDLNKLMYPTKFKVK